MTPPPKVVADRLFDGRAWTVTLHKRENGTTFFQLTELAGSRTDWPVVYSDGSVVFDHPERLPARVLAWAVRMVRAAEIGRGTVFRCLACGAPTTGAHHGIADAGGPGVTGRCPNDKREP